MMTWQLKKVFFRGQGRYVIKGHDGPYDVEADDKGFFSTTHQPAELTQNSILYVFAYLIPAEIKLERMTN